MDARTFVAGVYRLAPPEERPGARLASLVDAAHLAAIGEVVARFGELSAAELVGVEASQVASDREGPEAATVVRLTDPEAALAEIDRDGEALISATVTLEVDEERVGTVVLSLRLER
jgi:hypothetical protein